MPAFLRQRSRQPHGRPAPVFPNAVHRLDTFQSSPHPRLAHLHMKHAPARSTPPVRVCDPSRKRGEGRRPSHPQISAALLLTLAANRQTEKTVGVLVQSNRQVGRIDGFGERDPPTSNRCSVVPKNEPAASRFAMTRPAFPVTPASSPCSPPPPLR
jgi:hypothetical protein